MSAYRIFQDSNGFYVQELTYRQIGLSTDPSGRWVKVGEYQTLEAARAHKEALEIQKGRVVE